MRIENSFEVSAPEEACWQLLMDVPRVIPCMPGAELVETVDDSHWKARMRVKLGPISLSFLTDVRRDEVDEAARRVRLVTSAREERGRGAANATVDSSLVAAGGQTTVNVATDLTLSGAAAQFGRGLVNDVTAQLLKSFADCLERQLAETPEEAATPPEPEEAKPVSGLSVAAAALRAKLAQLWHRLLRR